MVRVVRFDISGTFRPFRVGGDVSPNSAQAGRCYFIQR